MTFAFPAFHENRLAGTFDAEAVESAMRQLRWSDIHRDGGSVVGKVGFNVWSFGETVTATLAPDHVVLRSTCVLPTQCIDWGKNRRNVEALQAALKQGVVTPSMS